MLFACASADCLQSLHVFHKCGPLDKCGALDRRASGILQAGLVQRLKFLLLEPVPGGRDPEPAVVRALAAWCLVPRPAGAGGVEGEHCHGRGAAGPDPVALAEGGGGAQAGEQQVKGVPAKMSLCDSNSDS